MSLFSAFDVPEGVFGYLEWTTGLMYMDLDRAQWDQFRDSKGLQREQQENFLIQRTLIHETYHFHQIAITGYLFKFVSRLFRSVVAQIGFPVTAARVKEWSLFPPPPSAAVKALCAELDEVGLEGLTVRAIVESAAYLFECQAIFHGRGLDMDAFLEQSRSIDGLTNEYRHAFDVARKYLGESTFFNFLPVATLSLCFDDPPGAFICLLHEAKHSGITCRTNKDVRELLHLPARISGKHKALGSSIQVAFNDADVLSKENLAKDLNPVFLSAALHYNSLAEKISPFHLLMIPSSIQDFWADIIQPFVFRGSPDRPSVSMWVPEAFRKRTTSGGDPQDRLHALVLLGALALRLVGGEVSAFRRFSVS